MMNKLILMIISLLSINILAADFEVVSNPLDCDILVVSDTGKKLTLGRTPFKMDMDALKAAHGQSGVVNVTIAKPGFESYNVVVPILGKSSVKINTSLEIEKDIKLTQDFDLLTSDLFDVLRMMRGKDYKSAYAKLELLEKKFPHFSIVYEMKGAILYLQNEYTMALNFYRKAFGINPENREAFKMKTYLEKKFGITAEQSVVEGKK